MPFGITLLAPAGHDMQLAAIGAAFHARSGLKLGASDQPVPPLQAAPPALQPGEIAIAVVGAHLSGMPLNGELRALNARLMQGDNDRRRLPAVRTARHRAAEAGPAAGRAWRRRVDRAGDLGADRRGLRQVRDNIPSPLGDRHPRLDDGSEVKGFLVEPAALDGARDISEFGGWRRLSSRRKRRLDQAGGSTAVASISRRAAGSTSRTTCTTAIAG